MIIIFKNLLVAILTTACMLWYKNFSKGSQPIVTLMVGFACAALIIIIAELMNKKFDVEISSRTAVITDAQKTISIVALIICWVIILFLSSNPEMTDTWFAFSTGILYFASSTVFDINRTNKSKAD